MTPERAAELLKAQQRSDSAQRRRERIRGLPRTPRAAAERLSEERWFGTAKLEATSAPLLESLPSAQRTEVFAAIQPHLGPELERFWTDGIGRPYQQGYTRKAFRAPRDPRVSLPLRHARAVAILDAIRDYEPDVRWLARWAAHLANPSAADALGTLFASTLDAGGRSADEVFEILVASAEGGDEVAAMGRHVTRALLAAARPDGWSYVERLLLAAQRQEGLRQVILESVDEAHPGAFLRMLRLILEHDLLRFPAAVRAVDVWFDFGWAAVGGRGLRDVLERVAEFLEDPDRRAEVLGAGDAESSYLALWCDAFEDAPAAVPRAAGLLDDRDPERRYAGVHLLAGAGVNTATAAAVHALDDPELRVAVRALDALVAINAQPVVGLPDDTFERLERLLDRVPKGSVTLDPIVWPWTARVLDQSVVARTAIAYRGTRDPARLIRHLGSMDATSRAAVARALASERRPTGEVRTALLSLVGDPAAFVRDAVIEAAGSLRLSAPEAVELERLLRRKAGDLRRAVVAMLLGQGGAGALASVRRLLAAPDRLQRLGGLELLRRMVETGTDAAEARELARRYDEAADRRGRTEEERIQLAAILGEARPSGEDLRDLVSEASTDGPAADAPRAELVGAPAAADLPAIPSLRDGLGLFDPARRTPPRLPRPASHPLTTDASVRLLLDLDALVHEHRDQPIELEEWSGVTRVPLGEASWRFPSVAGGPSGNRVLALPVPRPPAAVAAELEQARARLPLRDLWHEWAARRGRELRDADGLEFVRALFVPRSGGHDLGFAPPGWSTALFSVAGRRGPPVTLRYPEVTLRIVAWFVALGPPPAAVDFLLDAAEALLAAIPPGTQRDADFSDWRQFKRGWRDHNSPWLEGLEAAREFRRVRPDLWTAEQHARLWGLERWVEEGGPSSAVERAVGGLRGLVRRFRGSTAAEVAGAGDADGRMTLAPLPDIVAAFRVGVATPDDVVAALVGPAAIEHSPFGAVGMLSTLSQRTLPPFAAGDVGLRDIIEQVRRRVVEVELRRGEAPTAASGAALSLQHSGGLDVLVPIMRAIGAEPFVRGWTYDGQSRQVVFSRLIRATMPAEADTPQAFRNAVRALGLSDRRLVELACFAPQWADHVERALGWSGLASGVWWMHAHTKDTAWVVGNEVREAWAAAIAERTPLDTADLIDGAVDVNWFRAAFGELGPERWSVLDRSAKYASTSGGHKRAQLFADAMRGAATEAAVVARMTERRHQDSARALGLVPLPEGGTRDEAVLGRYRALQEFIRGSRQFGAARQASEKRAAEIGLANLARTAGYADPLRLSWAMEARGVADLADGPLVATAGAVEVSLSISETGEPDLVARRAGAVLKSVPAEAKRSAEVAALRARATDLRRQAGRIRKSLESAMVRGDGFRGAELLDLLRHPLLAPHLARLVLLGDGVAGYPIADGRALRDANGREHALGGSDELRIAHPVDLLAAGAEAWHAWQQDAFRREVVQPFKQVFRELYPATTQELSDGTLSRRYAGHQVSPRQALALLGGRGWVARPEEGISRTFHDLRLLAELLFLEPFYSPADVDGLTLEAVTFHRSGGERSIVPIGDVPPRIFSEVMRDLDLVVSVAHLGGVDPEASASTVEMRASLVEETCRLLAVENVRLDAPRAVIAGSLGEYSVHLGSGVVHRRPGGALFIVPVHSQHRGRLFLPFADDDPKSAEVLAKVLLLARDHEIRDPSILEQIRAV